MTYLIECPECEAIMGAIPKGFVIVTSENGTWKFTLAECPQCKGPILGSQEEFGISNDEPTWDDASRLWPSPPLRLHWKIPKEIKDSLAEANLCLKGKAYTASVAMCGRALEAIGKHFYPPTGPNARPLMLGRALDKLYKEEIIEKRLYEWGKALQNDRNLAAHPTGINFKREDASDVFKFANSICEYIFVLSSEFAAYKKRRQEPKK